MSCVFPGMRELLLLRQTLIDRGAITLQSNGVNEQGELSGKVERTVT